MAIGLAAAAVLLTRTPNSENPPAIANPAERTAEDEDQGRETTPVSANQTTASPTIIDDSTPLTNVEQAPSSTVTALVLADLPLGNGALSDEGRYLFALANDHQARADGPDLDAWCLVELETAAQSCRAGTPVEVGVPPFSLPVWSPDGGAIAWVSLGDIWVYDVGRDTFTNVTDDGYVDQSSEGLGKTEGDRNPTWLGSDELLFLTAGASNDGLTELVRIDATTGREISRTRGPTYEHTFRETTSLRSRWQAQWTPPLVIDLGVIISGDGVVYEIDTVGESFRTAGDYTAAYAPLAATFPERFRFQVADPPTLFPVAVLGSDTFLLYDFAVHTALNQGIGSGPSGYFVFNAVSGSLTPLLEPSPETDGHLGPLSLAISPSGTKAIVLWLDDRTRNERNAANAKLSIIELDNISDPIDLRSAPELWESSTPLLAGIPITTWTTNDRFLLTSTDRTIVFQLEVG